MSEELTKEETCPPTEPSPEAGTPQEKEGEDRGKWSSSFLTFVEKMNAFPTPEEKVAYGLHFMRETISQEGSPRFREFWESRRLVLPFFKENVNPAIRSKLWGEYVELTVEARKLKEILEEQSTFAMEQIDLAVQSIESDLNQFEKLLATVSEIEFPTVEVIDQSRVESYNTLQRELGLLNTLASRLNALRKEVVKTDMRIRFKTKFFKRLSELGDKIFPKRKTLIEQVSAEFDKDIEKFIAAYFKGAEVSGAPYYALREEIKALQEMAKRLTLSSATFNRTRLSLSECWDKIKTVEKENRRVAFEKRQASAAVCQYLQSKVEELKGRATEMSLADLDHEIEELSGEMRAVYLDREDVRSLQGDLNSLRAPHITAQEKKAREVQEAEQEKLRLRRERAITLKEKLAQAVKDVEQMEIEALQVQVEELLKELSEVEVTKMEKQQLERQFRKLKDFLSEKKESSLINLSEGDRAIFENLKLVLQQKKARRAEIKEHIENYRKTLGSSNLDFEKAMHYRDLLEQERELLEASNAAIEEIEQKLSDLEG